MRRLLGAIALTVTVCATGAAQTPEPFPRAQQLAPAPPQPARSALPTPTATDAAAPTAQSLGLPVYPAAQYLSTHDAGRGQKYVLFGTAAPFADIVVYYRTQLKEDGDLVFREPPTHMFEVGRFREETMVFPPGVTVKDFTWGGSVGYPNPKLNGQPARFPTVIMFVPQPPAPSPAAR